MPGSRPGCCITSPTATPLTILVATSGDTGSAVAQAFHGVPDTRVVVLYPQGQVSDVQEAQMASLGGQHPRRGRAGHVRRLPAPGQDRVCRDELRKHVWLTPANSINVGRLLPQVFYYFQLLKSWIRPLVSVPSGNFGNLTAGLIARRMGLPVRRFVAATNLNDAVPKYLESGRYKPRLGSHDCQRHGRRRAEQLRTHPVAVRQ